MRPAYAANRRNWLSAALALTVLTLTACASKPAAEPGHSEASASAHNWSGRIAVNELAEGGRSFSAGFELHGSASAGRLKILSPLGGVLRLLRWDAGGAWLEDGSGKPQGFADLAELSRRALGTELPVQALFDWLAGQPSAAPGWEADLSRHKEGRISATRQEPQPAVQLRVILD